VENCQFLPHDAMQSAGMPQYVSCPYVRLSVTFSYHDHLGWITSKITSWLHSLR